MTDSGAEWLFPSDVARDLRVSLPTARAVLRRIPGAEEMYRYEHREGSRWRVSMSDYMRWKSSRKRVSDA